MKLKEILFQKQMKQRDMSKYIGLHPSATSQVVNGLQKLPKKYLPITAKYLGFSIKQLMKTLIETKEN